MANKRIKHEMKMIAVLAILSVVFFALTFGIKTAEKSKTDVEKEYIDQATMADLPVVMEITSGDESFTLVRENSTWHIDGKDDVPVSDLKVTETRTVAKYFAPGRVLTEQGENLGKFGLTSPQAKVKMKAQNSEITYLIGDYNPVTGEYYAALEGSDTVYLIPRKDGDGLKKTLKEYVAEPGIVNASFNELNKIEVESGDLSYDITVDGGRYLLHTSQGEFEIDQARAMEIFNCFTSSVKYTCADYDLEGSEKAGFGLSDPAVSVRFTMSDGSTVYDMHAAEGADGGYYVTDGDGKIVYSIAESDYMNLMERIRLS